MGLDTNITDNRTGRNAGVTGDYQLKVRSESLALQHYISFERGLTFQTQGTATPVNGTVTVLHIRNDDPERLLCLSYIRLQQIDLANGTALPNASNYFELGFGRTVSSGGSSESDINVNRNSGATALVTSTDNGPTMAGTFVGIDTWWPTSDGDKNTYNKEGSIILGLNDTFEVRYVGDHTAGTLWARTTYMMLDRDTV